MIKSRNKSGQHYLLSAEARTLSLMQIMRLSDDEAFEMFKSARWKDGEPVCPQCGGVEHQAESFFSRLRRMHVGQTHKFGNNYLDRYAREAAYREDTRRRSNGAIFHDIMGRCASKRPSREFCGYWQGNKKTCEGLLL